MTANKAMNLFISGKQKDWNVWIIKYHYSGDNVTVMLWSTKPIKYGERKRLRKSMKDLIEAAVAHDDEER